MVLTPHNTYRNKLIGSFQINLEALGDAAFSRSTLSFPLTKSTLVNRRGKETGKIIIELSIDNPQTVSVKNIYPALNVVLLGSGSSGKSTFFKQINLLKCGRFDTKTLHDAQNIMVSNCIRLLIQLILFIRANNIIIPALAERASIIDHVVNLSEDCFLKLSFYLSSEIAQQIQDLWNDNPELNQVLHRYNYAMQSVPVESADYLGRFVELYESFELEQIGFIKTRLKTVGLCEVNVGNWNEIDIHIFDT